MTAFEDIWRLEELESSVWVQQGAHEFQGTGYRVLGLMGTGHWVYCRVYKVHECTGCRVYWVLSVLGAECTGCRVYWVPSVLGAECTGCRVYWVLSVLGAECTGC